MLGRKLSFAQKNKRIGKMAPKPMVCPLLHCPIWLKKEYTVSLHEDQPGYLG